MSVQPRRLIPVLVLLLLPAAPVLAQPLEPGPAETAPAPLEPPMPALPPVRPGTLAFGEAWSVGIPSLSFSIRTVLPVAGGVAGLATSAGLIAVGSVQGSAALATPGIVASGLASSAGPPVSLLTAQNVDSAARRQALSFGGQLAGSWQRYVETERLAWSVQATTSFSPTVTRSALTPGSAQQTQASIQFTPSVLGEVRVYPLRPSLPFLVRAAESLQDRLQWMHGNPSAIGVESSTWNSVYSRTELGVGWGRVLDVGAASRLRKLEHHLRARGVLSGPIPPEIGDRILATWYALRNDIGEFRHVAAFGRILADAGLAAAPFDGEAAYATAAIVRDTGFDAAWPSGWMVTADLAFEVTGNQTGSDLAHEHSHASRVTVFADGMWARPVGDDAVASLSAILQFDTGALDSYEPWALLVVQPRFTRHVYGRHLDAIGSLTAGALLVVGTALGSSRPWYDPQIGANDWAVFQHRYADAVAVPVCRGMATMELGANVAWTARLGRASSISAGLSGGLVEHPYRDTGWFLAASVGTTIGSARGGFSRY